MVRYKLCAITVRLTRKGSNVYVTVSYTVKKIESDDRVLACCLYANLGVVQLNGVLICISVGTTVVRHTGSRLNSRGNPLVWTLTAGVRKTAEKTFSIKCQSVQDISLPTAISIGCDSITQQ